MKKLNPLFTQPYLYAVIVILGIFLKFYKLEDQFFWDDEIATILHTSGIPMNVYERNIPVNEIIPKKYFDDLLKLNDRDLKFFDQFFGLSKMPQLTPGHYYYFIFLTRIFGDNYMVYRYFSVLVFLLSVVFLFLLTKKIFNSNRAAWIAISLYSVSPFFQTYAQEARYYILWSFTVIFMHYLFLVAMEKKKIKWWILYVAAGFLAVHVTILFYITLLAQVIYTLICYRTYWKALFLSQFAIFLTSIPWLIYIMINRGTIHDSLEWHKIGPWNDLNVFDLLLIHAQHFIELFAYFNKLGFSGFILAAGKWIYGLMLTGAIFIFFRRAENKQKWFVALLTFLGVVALTTLDLIRSSGSSDLSRYVLLNFIGMILLVSFAFQKAMEKRALITGTLFLIVITSGLLSSLAVANDVSDGNRADSPFHVKDAAEKFSGDEHVLIISDFNLIGPYSYSMFMSLMHASKNENIDVIYAKPDYPDFKKDFDFSAYDKLYGMYLSDNLSDHLKKIYTPEELTILEERKVYGRFDLSVYNIGSKMN